MKHDIDIGRLKNLLRAESKRAFGKEHRLAIIAVLGALEPPVWSRRVAKALDVAENQAAVEVANLAEMGALQRFPSEHDRRKIYQPVSHPIWGFARELLEKAIRDSSDGEGDEVAGFWVAVLDQAEPAPIPEEMK